MILKNSLKMKKIKYGFGTLDNENCDKVYNLLETQKKNDYKKAIKKEDFGKDLHIDNYYIASSNQILLCLKRDDFEGSEIYENLYKYICESLFDKDTFTNIIQFLFNPKKIKKTKKNEKQISIILMEYFMVIDIF